MANYIWIPGLHGGATARRYAGWSKIHSFGYGAMDGGGTADDERQRNVNVTQLHILRASDHLTPALVERVVRNRTIPHMVLESVSGDAGKKLLTRIILSNAKIRELNSQHGNDLAEKLQIGYESIQWEYADPQNVLSRKHWSAVLERMIAEIENPAVHEDAGNDKDGGDDAEE